MTGQAHVLYRNKLTAAAHAVLAAGLRDRCPSKPSGLCRRSAGGAGLARLVAGEGILPLTDLDRLYFGAHPERNYRLRRQELPLSLLTGPTGPTKASSLGASFAVQMAQLSRSLFRPARPWTTTIRSSSPSSIASRSPNDRWPKPVRGSVPVRGVHGPGSRLPARPCRPPRRVPGGARRRVGPPGLQGHGWTPRRAVSAPWSQCCSGGRST